MNELVMIKAPLSVNYEVSPLCDLRCVFCFNSDAEYQTLEHPPISQVKSILAELAKAEVFEVRLFGGEFFVYPLWEEALVYADSLDFFLSFVSNGTHITEEVASKLISHRVKRGAISLHGTQAVHDKITGVPGSFNQAVRGIQACLDSGLDTSILYTLTRENCLSIFESCQLFKSIGISEVNVGRLTPYGRAKSDWEKKKLTLADYMKVFSQLERVRSGLGLSANFGDAFPLCVLPLKYQDYVTGCWQGTGFGHIDHVGNVRSCSIAKGSYGNILETPLVEIWTNRLSHFRSLEWLPMKCRQCDDFCGGGCSASCYDGGMYAPDEFIPHDKGGEHGQ